ncbi:glycosyltransferase [Marinobacter nauticus]|uniref:glycosyltransferase n=1 Tax=Marinobacter nauticus TaxID=2743 RepID=UPI001D1860C0|nr:glycosyltransferase [Marinobacter nauticus]MCC4269667.1 glycosyltransferase [Marinobacter nauticus]
MLLALVEAQQESGLEPMILSVGEPGIEEKAIEKEADRLGLPLKTWRMKPGLNRNETLRICQWADEWGADLVHSHGYKFNILLGLFGRFKKEIPFVATLHGYVHAPLFTRMWVYEKLDRLVLRRMSAVVLVGEAMRKELPSGLRYSEKVAVIRNGLKVESILRKAKEPVPEEVDAFIFDHDTVILGVGRLSSEKQFGKLILSFEKLRQRFPKAGLVIAGDGYLRGSLEQSISERALDKHVLLAGYCSNIPAIMARSHILAISSATEGLPITLLEAMALRLPVVSTSVGEIPEVLENGANGVLIESIEEELVEAMENALADSDAARERSERASKNLARELSAQAMAEQYSVVYERALAS